MSFISNAEQTMRDLFTLEDVRRLEDKLSGTTGNEQFYRQIQKLILEKTHAADTAGAADATDAAGATGAADAEEEDVSSALDVEPDTRSFGRSNFGINFKFGKYLETLDEKTMLDRCICNICGDVAQDPHITDCKHVFCKDCIQQRCLQSASAGSDYTECPACRFAFNRAEPYAELSARENDTSQESLATEADTDARRGTKEKAPKDDWLKMGGDLLPSAKLTAVKVSRLCFSLFL